ncbi:MAG: serine hydrolase domain-containing protein [Gammaproteobacteria bacterium]
MKNKLTAVAMLATLLGVAGAIVVGGRLLELYTAYAAKTTCSGVFVSGREVDEVLSHDFVPDGDPLFVLASWLDVSVDVYRKRGRVNAHVAGRFARAAQHSPGFGCTLMHARGGEVEQAIAAPRADDSSPKRTRAEVGSRPAADSLPVRPDSKFANSKFDDVLDWAFAEPRAGPPRRTRAVVVLHEGAIVAERYAAPFDEDTPLMGWSMTKSVFNALVGRLVHQGRLDLDAEIDVSTWAQGPGSAPAVTYRHLLTMSAGNAFDETHLNPYSDVIQMLLFEPAAGAYAAGVGYPSEPGTQWRYASADTNILSLALRRHLGDDEAYWSWPRRALFGPLGMSSAVIERDASGSFVGSSFMLATARDWARLGQLYVQDGVWHGQRLLPEGWVELSRTPGASNAGGIYGAHFWLRARPSALGSNATSTGLPDALHAVGHDQQYLSIVPSKALVAVRLGLTRNTDGWKQSEFLQRIVERL